MKTLAKITLDFYRNNYVVVNAKQYDHLSRQIDISLTNNGEFFAVDKSTMYATVQTKSPSGVSRFETLTMNDDGTVSFVLTNQHLTEYGNLNVEIVIFQASDYTRLATVDFTVHILKSNYKGVEQDIIESDQFAALTEALNTALYNYDIIVTAAEAARDAAKVSEDNAAASALSAATSSQEAKDYDAESKSWAVGTGGVVRAGDDTDNSKYYAQQSQVEAANGETYLQGIQAEYSRIISQTGGILFAMDTDNGCLYGDGKYNLMIDYDASAASGTGYLCYEYTG